MKRGVLLATTLAGIGALPAAASDTMADMGGMGDSIDDLLARGEQIYFEDGGCVNCHGEVGDGDAGPALNAKARTPLDVSIAFKTVPRMAPFVNELNPEKRDYLAIAMFLTNGLAKEELHEERMAEFHATLETFSAKSTLEGFTLTSRDEAIMEISPWETEETWERRAKEGSLKQTYDSKVLETWDWPAEDVVFRPEPGKTYFYENTGIDKHPGSADLVDFQAVKPRVTIGDAETHKVIASRELPAEMKGTIHSTFATADGKYIYISGGKYGQVMSYTHDHEELSLDAMADGPAAASSMAAVLELMSAPATLIKVEAATLRPVAQVDIGGRVHHGQLFQDRYLLIDTFSTAENGLDVFLYDPETDSVIGGVRNVDLGGAAYTAWTDNEFIYVLMEPVGYDPMSLTHTGYMGGVMTKVGKLTTLRDFWVAKIDPETWEVVHEYTYPGHRGDWIAIDSKKEHMYIPAGATGNISKVKLDTGELVWANAVGTGPYGATLNADETEVWVANKGETTGLFGRTLTVLDANTGWPKHTLMTGYMTDHVLLAPNGKEIWATSNGEGRIYVYDAATYELKTVMDMPGNGDAHGLVWATADENANLRVVRDQGNFHSDIHPAKGKPLLY
ncbi:hypothetical protein R3X27_13035 [Tropicimonas sp. TH_r6]|uniref:hypothetical protein n=1 Tax=Tropicimonas sp. TH_r6 TaxID=3082085 RepID=UPI002952DBF7|nr:hypothetical protein [Tropicimonas sp. TH_r6]MDV7143604.1 hypothetical protein [Tropicimonas sp. TH_r6]